MNNYSQGRQSEPEEMGVQQQVPWNNRSVERLVEPSDSFEGSILMSRMDLAHLIDVSYGVMEAVEYQDWHTAKVLLVSLSVSAAADGRGREDFLLGMAKSVSAGESTDKGKSRDSWTGPRDAGGSPRDIMDGP